MAYDLFKSQDHIMGAYFSKKCQNETYIIDSDEEEDEFKLQFQAEERVWESKFEQYLQKTGIENSSYIIRELGPEISLMSEIVFTQFYNKDAT